MQESLAMIQISDVDIIDIIQQQRFFEVPEGSSSVENMICCGANQHANLF